MSAPWYVPWGLLQPPGVLPLAAAAPPGHPGGSHLANFNNKLQFFSNHHQQLTPAATGHLQLYAGDYLTLSGLPGGSGLFSPAALAGLPLNLPLMNSAAVAASQGCGSLRRFPPCSSASSSQIIGPPHQGLFTTPGNNGGGSPSSKVIVPLLRTPLGVGSSSSKDLRASSSSSSGSLQSASSLANSTSPSSKRKLEDSASETTGPYKSDVKKAKLETKALKAKRPGFTDERYNETTYYHDHESKLRKVYPYYFTFTTFTKGRWVGEKILDVFAREFRAHPAEEYERCIKAGTLTVNYEKVDVDYRLKHNDLLANIVHRHEVPVSSQEIKIIHMDDELVVVNKPASIPVHPCGRYRHNTVVFILAKEYGLKNLRTIHRLDRLTSGLLLFGRNPKKAREMEQQIRTRQCQKEYVCRVEGEFPTESIICKEPIEVISYKIGVCKVSPSGKDCLTEFQRLSYNGHTSVVLCKPHTGRMHQIRVHLQFLGYPVINDPLYNHPVFGPLKGKGGNIGKTDEELIADLISIHNAENWLGMDESSNSAGGAGSPSSSGFLLGPNGSSNSVNPSSNANGISTAIRHEDGGSSFSSNGNNSSSDINGKSSGVPRVETPDSAVDMMSSTADSPLENFSSEVPSASCVIKDEEDDKVTTATQTGIEEADIKFNDDKMTYDSHCYECKVKYRDPKPKDLIMYLHAVKYSGPEWTYATELPDWANENWVEVVYED